MTTSRLKDLIFVVEYTQYEATLHHIDAYTMQDDIDYNQLHNTTGNFCLRLRMSARMSKITNDGLNPYDIFVALWTRIGCVL